MNVRLESKKQYALAKKIGLPVTYTEILHNVGVLPKLEHYAMPKCQHCNFLILGEATCSECQATRPIKMVDLIWKFQGKLIHSRGEESRMFLRCPCGCPYISALVWDSECFQCKNEVE